jgi:hypothetical protein
MGRPTPQSHSKRLREQTKKDKRRAKDEKRAARKAEKQTDELPDENALPTDATNSIL